MRKWIILAGILLALLITLAAIAVRNLNAYLNQNRVWIAQQVERALGRSVRFDEVGVSLHGGLGVEVSNLRIGDDPAFSSEDFLRTASARIRMKVLPALFGRYEVRRVVLDAPAVTLVRTGRGLNAATLGTSARAPEEKEPARGTEAQRPEGRSGLETLAVVVAHLSIDNGTLRFIDRTRKPPVTTVIERLDLFASDVDLAKPIEFKLVAAVLGASKQNATVSGSIGPVGLASPGATPVDVEIDLGPIAADTVARVEPLAGAMPPALSASGRFRLTATAKGSFDQMQIDMSLNASDTAFTYAGVMQKPAGVPFRVALAGGRTTKAVNIDRGTLALHTAELSVRGKITTASGIGYALDIESNAVPLQGWERLLPPLVDVALAGVLRAKLHVQGVSGRRAPPALAGTITLSDVRARGKGLPAIEGLSTAATLENHSITLTPATFTMGGSPVALEAKVDDLRDPIVAFSLTSAALGARSLGLAGEGVAKAEELRDLSVRGNLRFPDGGPEFRGAVASSAGSLRDVDYQALGVRLQLRNRRAAIDHMSWRVFGGVVKGKGACELSDAERPTCRLEMTARGLELRQLLAAGGRGSKRVVEGTLAADLALTGAGREWPAIQQELAGDGRIDVRDGSLKDVNIAEGVIEGITGLPGLTQLISARAREKYPRVFGTDDTQFDTMGGDFVIKDGRLTTDNLTLAAEDYRVRGKGSFGFDRTVDFRAGFEASEALTQDLIAQVKEAKYLAGGSGRVEIPFRLRGQLPGVRPQSDLDAARHALQRALVGAVADRLLGGGKKGKQPEQPPQGEGTPARPRRSSLEDAIKDGLKGVLGK